MNRRKIAPALSLWMSDQIVTEEAKPEAVREFRALVDVVRAARRFMRIYSDPGSRDALSNALARLSRVSRGRP